MDNKTALQMIAHRINGVQARVFTADMEANLHHTGVVGSSFLTQDRADVEIARLEAAREDVLSRMSQDDVVAVEAAVAADNAAHAERKSKQLSKLIKK